MMSNKSKGRGGAQGRGPKPVHSFKVDAASIDPPVEGYATTTVLVTFDGFGTLTMSGELAGMLADDIYTNLGNQQRLLRGR